jgi:hypothetical protein
VNSYALDGNVLEWCQPLWEPGNVLSYPWTEAQLLALLPRTYVSNKSNVWAADSSGSNASVTLSWRSSMVRFSVRTRASIRWEIVS